ncbi:energy-coupled thiamine transporter ThiT [Oscillospiraceae bacterium WX1]
MKRKTTLILVECAMMIAMSVVLSFIKLYEFPQGGAVTLASMAPLVLVSYRHGIKWGLAAAFVYSLLQMILPPGFYPPPAKTFMAFAGVVLLDYVIAFTVLGTAAFFGKPFKNKVLSAAVGAVAVTVLRLTCHFFSGILIWGSYAPEGTPVWLYSLTYNGTYMVWEIIITAVVVAILVPVLDRIDRNRNRTA